MLSPARHARMPSCQGGIARGRAASGGLLLSSLLLVFAFLFLPSLLVLVTPSSAQSMCSRMNQVVILDGSGSVSATQFAQARQFLRDLVEAYPVSSGGVNVGLIQFASQTRVETSLLSDPSALLGIINNMQQLAGETYAATSLNLARDMLNSTTDLARSVIFITDGISTDDPIPTTTQLKNAGVTVITVGVGTLVSNTVLAQMATSGLYYQLSTWNDISSLVGVIRSRFCGSGFLKITAPLKAAANIDVTQGASMTLRWTTTNTGRVQVLLMRSSSTSPTVDRVLAPDLPSVVATTNSYEYRTNASSVIAGLIYHLRLVDVVQGFSGRSADFSFTNTPLVPVPAKQTTSTANAFAASAVLAGAASMVVAGGGGAVGLSSMNSMMSGMRFTVQTSSVGGNIDPQSREFGEGMRWANFGVGDITQYMRKDSSSSSSSSSSSTSRSPRVTRLRAVSTSPDEPEQLVVYHPRDSEELIKTAGEVSTDGPFSLFKNNIIIVVSVVGGVYAITALISLVEIWWTRRRQRRLNQLALIRGSSRLSNRPGSASSASSSDSERDVLDSPTSSRSRKRGRDPNNNSQVTSIHTNNNNNNSSSTMAVPVSASASGTGGAVAVSGSGGVPSGSASGSASSSSDVVVGGTVVGGGSGSGSGASSSTPEERNKKENDALQRKKEEQLQHDVHSEAGSDGDSPENAWSQHSAESELLDTELAKVEQRLHRLRVWKLTWMCVLAATLNAYAAVSTCTFLTFFAWANDVERNAGAMTLAVFLLLFYVCGFPILFMFLATAKVQLLREDGSNLNLRFGSLFYGFFRDRSWFLMISLAKELLIVFWIVFLMEYPIAQIVLLACTHLSYILLVIFASPFKERWEEFNELFNAAMNVLQSVILLIMAWQSNDGLPPNATLSILLLSVNLALILVNAIPRIITAVIFLVKASAKGIRKLRDRRALKKQQSRVGALTLSQLDAKSSADDSLLTGDKPLTTSSTNKNTSSSNGPRRPLSALAREASTSGRADDSNSNTASSAGGSSSGAALRRANAPVPLSVGGSGVETDMEMMKMRTPSHFVAVSPGAGGGAPQPATPPPLPAAEAAAMVEAWRRAQQQQQQQQQQQPHPPPYNPGLSILPSPPSMAPPADHPRALRLASSTLPPPPRPILAPLESPSTGTGDRQPLLSAVGSPTYAVSSPSQALQVSPVASRSTVPLDLSAAPSSALLRRLATAAQSDSNE